VGLELGNEVVIVARFFAPSYDEDRQPDIRLRSEWPSRTRWGSTGENDGLSVFNYSSPERKPAENHTPAPLKVLLGS